MGRKTELKAAATERRSLRHHGREPAAARFGGVVEYCAYTSKCGLFGTLLHSPVGLLQPLLNMCFVASLTSLYPSTHL